MALLSLMLMASMPGCTERPGPPGTDLDKLLTDARNDGKLVMLELGSVGCIPCENMKPVMQRLRQDYEGKLEVIFIDVNQERNIAARYGVYSIPVQVFLDGAGVEFHRHVGFYPYEEIVPVLSGKGL